MPALHRYLPRYLPRQRLLMLLTESLALFLSLVSGLYLLKVPSSYSMALGVAAALTTTQVAMMAALGLYRTHVDTLADSAQRLAGAWLLSLALISVQQRLMPQTAVAPLVLWVASLLALASVFFIRAVLLRSNDLSTVMPRILVLGGGSEADRVVAFLQRRDIQQRLRFSGVYPAGGDVAPGAGDMPGSAPAPEDPLLRTVVEFGINEIVIALRERRGGALPLNALLNCQLLGIRITESTEFIERHLGQLDLESLRLSWLIHGQEFERRPFSDIAKRIMDLLLGIPLTLAALPLAVPALLALSIERRGWPLGRFRFLGQGARVFLMWTLPARSPGRDGPVRRTLDRLGMDRLVRLANLLAGDLSLIGPSPSSVEQASELELLLPLHRLKYMTPPGLTGWCQIRYPYDDSVQDALHRHQYDLFYVKNRSFLFDLMILVQSVERVLLGRSTTAR